MIGGLDASNVNGNIDLTSLRTQYGLSFVFLKATEGTGFLDPLFPAFWLAAEGLGLARGAYHFAHPGQDPREQADAFLAYVRSCGLGDDDMLGLDLEVSDGLTPAEVSRWAREFCAIVQPASRRPLMVYTFVDFAIEGNCAGLGHQPLWIASWNGTPGRPVIPSPWKTWAVHQYTSQGIDLDVANYPDAAAMTAALGKPRPHPSPPPPPAPHQEDDVQSGELNSGPGAVTVITVPWGSASNIAFGCDNNLQGLPPAKLRVAIFDTQWHVSPDVTVSSAKGQTVLKFSDKGQTGVISVRREDSGDAVVGWQVS